MKNAPIHEDRRAGEFPTAEKTAEGVQGAPQEERMHDAPANDAGA